MSSEFLEKVKPSLVSDLEDTNPATNVEVKMLVNQLYISAQSAHESNTVHSGPNHV